jgi:hypothetical protein
VHQSTSDKEKVPHNDINMLGRWIVVPGRVMSFVGRPIMHYSLLKTELDSRNEMYGKVTEKGVMAIMSIGVRKLTTNSRSNRREYWL